jgi:DNA-binding response OmpR family regulator
MVTRFPQAPILIVDDSEPMIAAMHELLAEAGYERVAGIDSPEDAVDRCQRERAAAVLLDINMPRVDGWRVLAGLTALGEAERPVIVVMSAHAEAAYKTRALTLGADAYLIKPVDIDLLLGTVDRLLSERVRLGATRRAGTAQPPPGGEPVRDGDRRASLDP